MVGATRPGRVLLIYAACYAAVGGAIWYTSLPAPVSRELNEQATPLPTQTVSEADEKAVPEPQPSRLPDPRPLPEPPELPPTALPTIDAHSPLDELLPTPPPVKDISVYLGEDLERVPELKLEAPPAEGVVWERHQARTSVAALALNEKEQDGFVKALLRTRPDLSGLPFQMGNACRKRGLAALALKSLAPVVRSSERALDVRSKADQKEQPHYDRAHAALLAQVLPAEATGGQLRFIEELASINDASATRELARIAVFSPDDSVRSAALDALAERPARESTDVLVAGLSYPWPAATRNAARAIVKLKRTDLIPQLEAMLDVPDPRGPTVESDGSRKVTAIREVVRINHHRNCLLCHAPAVQGKTFGEALTAEIPLPPRTSMNYSDGPRTPSQRLLLVRIDVTYLRQDFSDVQPVLDSSKRPTTQRFDFFVRKRVLTPDEARDLRERLKGRSPYHVAAALALHQLKRL